MKLKPGTVRDKAEDLLRRMRKALAEVSYFDLQQAKVHDVLRLIRARMAQEEWTLDFFRWAEQYLQMSTMAGSTRATYRNAISALKRFWGFPTLEINQITVSLLQDFIHYLAEEPLQHFDKKKKATSATTKKKRSGTGDRLYLARLATIFRAARTRYNDEDHGIIRIPGDPFAKVRIHAAPSRGQSALPIDVIRMMIADDTTSPWIRRALDIAVVSFCTCGANMADLYVAVPPRDGIWRYNRQKTMNRRPDSAEMRVRIPAQAAPFIERLCIGAKKDKWLNLTRHYNTADNATRAVNKQLKAWALSKGLEQGFTFYAIRKAWATIARSRPLCIEKATIDECLVHIGDFPVADIYIGRDWELLWEANEKVMSYVFNTE